MLVLAVAFPATAQTASKLKFKVESFAQDQFDTSARTGNAKKMDDDGNLFALIKVQSPSHDNLNEYIFDFGRPKCEKAIHGDELWLYVQKSAKRVKIRRQGYYDVDQDLGLTVQPGANYVMVISSETPVVLSQKVQFQFNPPVTDASIIVKRREEGAPERRFGTYTGHPGVFEGILKQGTYNYTVYVDNYDTVEGMLSLFGEEDYVERVNLTSTAGRITLKVADNADAEIYMDSRYLAKRQWSGILPEGEHTVETKMPYHTTRKININVVRNDTRQIELPAPTPINAQVVINSSPAQADIVVDGVNMGRTPKVMNLLTGPHTLKISKDGYAAKTQDFTVAQNRENEINVTLDQRAGIHVTTIPSGASVYLDGRYIGTSPLNMEALAGRHDISAYNYHCTSAKKTVTFGRDTNVLLKLRTIVLHNAEFYMSAGAGWSGSINVGATMGFQLGRQRYTNHFGGWNFEASYAYGGLGSGTKIYFNQVTDVEGVQAVRQSWEAEYVPEHIISARTGWAIPIGTRLKITPQAGWRMTIFGSPSGIKRLSPEAPEEMAADAPEYFDCHSMTLGARIFLATSYRCGFSVTPEYAFALMKSEGYKTVSELDSKCKSACEGFGINVSFVLTF